MAIVEPVRYQNMRDVNRRLHGTVVRYKGRPVYVDQNGNRERERGDDLTVDLRDVLTRTWIPDVHSSDEDLDIRAFPIGYAEYRGTYRYFTRMPVRHDVAGLNNRSLCYWTRDDGSLVSKAVARDILVNQEFHKSLAGVYPSFDEALSLVQKENTAGFTVGIHRKLAIFEDDVGLIKLAYFNRPVGVYNENKKSFVVNERLAKYVPIIKSMGVVNCEV